MIDPRTKIFGVLFFIGALFFLENPLELFIVLIFIHLMFLPSVGKEKIRNIWKNLLPLSLFILILWPLFDPSKGEILFEWAFIKIGWDNIRSSLVMVLRLCDIVFLCYYPILTISQSTMILALIRLGLPYHWAFTIILAMQAVPDFTNRWQQVRQAQQVRGLELNRGNFIVRLRNLLPLLTAVIVSVLRESDQLAYSLINRGMDRKGKRTWLENLVFRWYDWAILLLLTSMLFFLIIEL